MSYIVRSIDYLLKTRFSRPKGLADENTLILDPATARPPFFISSYGRFMNNSPAKKARGIATSQNTF